MMAESGTATRTRGRESLLPWYAIGQLSQPETDQIDRRLARESSLALIYASICEERDATVAMNERLGIPSPRALQSLFAAIDLDIETRKKSF